MAYREERRANVETMTLQDLYCVRGKHDWRRVRVRGRAPLHCPQHRRGPRIRQQAILEPQVLFCQNGGHSWEREQAPGVRPLNCPEHPAAPAPGRRPAHTRVDIEQCADEIVKAHKAGKSMRELARLYGCAFGTIRRQIKAAEKAAEPRSGHARGDRVRLKVIT